MSQSYTVRSHKSAPRIPDFIARRVDKYEAETRYASVTAHSLLAGRSLAPGDIDLRSNDYLSVGRHSDVIESQVAAIRASANQQMMSAVFLAGKNDQSSLEQRFSDWLRCDDTVMFQSGYVANVALLQNIADAETPVYLDMMAHASLFQGVACAGAQARAFRHNDPDHLRRQIIAHGPGVVCIDSVYSTNGSVAPISAILDVAEEQGCALIVDESHSLGTHGPGGAGLVVALGLEDRVHFRTASLAKAMCGRAGLVACPESTAYYLRYASMPYIFSSAVLPHELGALGKTLDIIQSEGWRRERLHQNADRLRGLLDCAGYNVDASQSQIISLEAGTEGDLVRLSMALNARGVLGAPFFAPATAKNRACLRFSVNAALSLNEVERVASACALVHDEVGAGKWASARRKRRPVCSGITRGAGVHGLTGRIDRQFSEPVVPAADAVVGHCVQGASLRHAQNAALSVT